MPFCAPAQAPVLWDCPGFGASSEFSVPKYRAGESRVMLWEVVVVSSGRLVAVGEVFLCSWPAPSPAGLSGRAGAVPRVLRGGAGCVPGLVPALVSSAALARS